MHKIILLGSPLSTNHIYKIATRPFLRNYMTNAGKKRKEEYIQSAMEQYKKNPLSDNIEVEITLYFGDRRVRDWDNYNKIVMDSLNGIIWEDDRQIIKAIVIKEYDKENPRIEIKIKPYEKNK